MGYSVNKISDFKIQKWFIQYYYKKDYLLIHDAS